MPINRLGENLKSQVDFFSMEDIIYVGLRELSG